MDATEPSSSTNNQTTTGTEDSTPTDGKDDRGFFGTGSMTGAFSQAMSGTGGTVGISVLGGLIITPPIILRL